MSFVIISTDVLPAGHSTSGHLTPMAKGHQRTRGQSGGQQVGGEV